MPKTARSKSKPASMPDADQQLEATRARPTQEDIATRAYQIYVQRGEAEGDALGDWLRAERELTEADAANAVVK